MTSSHSDRLITVKKYAYLIIALPLLLPVISILLANFIGVPNLLAFFTVFVVFGIIPIIDVLLGKDAVNPNEKTDVARMSEEKFYYWLPLLCLPAYALLLVWGGYVFMRYDFSLIGQFGWVLSIGVVGGIAGINVAHELIHKDSQLEKNVGGLLLALVSYAGFKVEHIRGHHVHVSTPKDASSSRFNQSLYQFLPHAYYHNVKNAFLLEAERLRRKGMSPWGLKNELIWFYGFTVLCLIGFTVAWGWMGSLFFLGQSFVAFTLLEIVNYLEHYGLHRRKLDNGRFERVTPEHSWNSNFLLTNLFLFQLQRHSDHHAYPKRRYQVLRHHDHSPQLPAGYATMVLLALVPPLWRYVMNPRVKAYYAGEEHQLSDSQIKA